MPNYTSKEIFLMTSENLIQYLNTLCYIKIPDAVETIEDMQQASKILGRLGPLYAWLLNMELMANVQKKKLKKTDKEKYEDAIIRETIFASYAKQTNVLYSTVSRMITIKQQVNQELRMLGHTV